MNKLAFNRGERMKPEIQADAFYTIQEAAGILGMGRNTIAAHIARGELKAAHFGTKTYRIKGSDLLSWYEKYSRSGKKDSTTE